MTASTLGRFQARRGDPRLVVLEGFHAVKHALRFGADVVEIEAADPDEVIELARELAPDLTDVLARRVTRAAQGRFEGITGRVVASARRPVIDLGAIFGAPGAAPVVLLDHPRHLGNIGAAIRAAAAAGADAVVTTGTADPWHVASIRGAAGLQFALPVDRIDRLRPTARTVVALDPAGERLDPNAVPPGAVLAFGSERRGLSPEIRDRAEQTFALPMRAGVSSLNLATAVAGVLYGLRLGTTRAVRARGLEPRPPD